MAVGDLFGISKATVSRAVHRVAATFARLLPRYVCFHDAGGSIAAGYLRISGQYTKCGEINHVTQTCRHEHAVSCFVCCQQGHKSKHHAKRV